MQKSTLFILLVLVAALGGGVWWSGNQVVAFEESLFPGVSSTDVVSVRVDNVFRDVQVRIDRDDRGHWKIVDPIEADADEVVLQTLMDAIDKDRLRLVPGDVDPANFGFEPAQIVFQVETRSGERHSVEIGTVDVADNTVHLLIRGKVYRAPLRLHMELSHDLNNFRRPFAFKQRIEELGEIHRTGQPLVDSHSFGYEFHALRENDGWRLISPFAAGLHPSPMSLFLTNTVRIRIASHFSRPLNLVDSGLQPPQRTIEYSDLGGTKYELQIGYGEAHAKFSCRAMPGDIQFQAAGDAVQRLEIPIEFLLDRRLVRAPREFLERIELESVGRVTLHFIREGDDWTLREEGRDEERPTDPRRFDAFLSKLETVLFYDLLEVDLLDPAEVRGEIRFSGAGEEWAVQIGDEFLDEGTPCLRVQHVGDGIIGSLELSDAKFLETSVAELRDHRLSLIDELTVSGLVLRSGNKSRRWNRDDKGAWTREGNTSEAFEILSLLDPLLNLRAENFVQGEFDLGNPVVVEVHFSEGETFEMRLGRVQVGKEFQSVFDGEHELAILAPEMQTLPEKIEALLQLD